MELRKISANRISAMIEALTSFNRTPGEGITRIALSDEDMQARGYIKAEMQNLGLEVRQDAAGNIFGRLPGENPLLSPVWTGSHIDTVLHGGAYDGMAGVVCALEAVRLIKSQNLSRKRDIEVVVFTSEEPTRFGLGCIGSRILASKLTFDDAQRIIDEDGQSLADILNADPGAFEKAAKTAGSVHSFVELHIEQAEQLEQSGKSIGIVHTISAPTEIHITIEGKQRHAGATPMHLRRDPLPALAEIALMLERVAKDSLETSTVATIGRVNLFPNASNVIPAWVEFTVDIRSGDYSEKKRLLNELFELIGQIEEKRSLKTNMKVLCDDKPSHASQAIVGILQRQCRELDYPYLNMASGAYHDSMFVSGFAPFSMIFVPSKNGISHDKDEWTCADDLAKGTNVLASALLELSNEM